VVEAPAALRLEPGHGGEDLLDHPAQRAGLDAAARLDGGQLLRRPAPDLAGVGEVEVAADRRPQPAVEHAGERLLSAALLAEGEYLAGHVAHGAEGEAQGQREEQIQRLEGEVYPLAAQADAAVAWPVEQVVAEHLLDIGKDARLAGR